MAHYKSYCLILSKIIKTAKQHYYNNKISKSNNKINTTWDIIKMETCKNHINKGIQLINIDGNLITNEQLIANSFNNYFLPVADKITGNIKNYKASLNCNNLKHCLHKKFKLPCSNMKLKCTIPKDIEKIIKSLKTKNSHGYAGSLMKILKVSTSFITPLTYICNKSISSGIFPS
jgi:archaellum component FlaF (FlaF/FlaG flagellin family)